MRKVVTSVTTFATAEGTRLSVTASTIDDSGKIIESNKRFNRIITDADILAKVNELNEYASKCIDE